MFGENDPRLIGAVQSVILGGNTAGATSSGTGPLYLAGGNSLTLSAQTAVQGGMSVTFSVGNYITTAALSQNTSNYAGINTSVATTAGTDITLGVNTSGVTIGYPKWITTADLSQNSSKYAGTNTSVATTAGTDITLGVNTSGVTIGYPKAITTAALSSQTLGFSLSGNTATTNSSQISNGAYALAGGNNVTLQQSNNTVSISVGNYITTGALSSQTLNFTLGGNFSTTNSSQIINSGYMLAGGANVTIQQSNNTISISAAAAAAAPINVSAGTTSQNIGSIKFVDSNGVSWGLGTGASSQSLTATVATNYLTTAALSSQTLVLSNSQTYYSTGTIALSEAGGAITIQTTAGGNSFMFSVPATSSIVGVNGISISTNASTISVSYVPMLSQWANRDMFIDDNSTTFNPSVSALIVAPFVMPQPISGAFIRIPVSMSMVSTETAATTANSTVTYNRTYSQAVVIYTQNAGASSLSLASYTSTVGSWVFQALIGAGAQGSRYTVTYNVTYPVSGTTSQYTTSSAQSSANIAVSTNQMTLFTGLRWVDIPFAASLPANNYWIAFGTSTNSATTNGPAGISGASMGMSMIGVSHSNVQIGVPGLATNSSIHLIPGLGSWSTNAAVMTTGSLQLASISMQSSHPLPYFQIARFA